MIKIQPNINNANCIAMCCQSCGAEIEKCKMIEIRQRRCGSGFVFSLCRNCMLELIAKGAAALIEN